MPTGSIAAINSGEMHTGYAANPKEGWAYRMLYPEPNLLKRVAREITGRDLTICQRHSKNLLEKYLMYSYAGANRSFVSAKWCIVYE